MKRLWMVLVATALAMTIRISPSFADSNSLMSYDSPSGMTLMDEMGNDVKTFSQSGSHPVLSPNKTKVAFAMRLPDLGTDQLYVMNVDGTNVQQLSHDTRYNMSIGDITWSPDGSKIAYEIGDDGIYVVPVDGQENPVKIVDRGIEPDWSPEGSKIVFAKSSGRGGDALYTYNVADGTIQTVLQMDNVDLRQPDWSPDGQKIAFSHFDMNVGEGGGPIELWTVNADGTGVTAVTPDDYQDQVRAPQWSPDGTKIAYTRLTYGAPDGDYHFTVMDLQTNEKTNIKTLDTLRFIQEWR